MMRDICDAAGLWLAGKPQRRGSSPGEPPPLNQPPTTVADSATVFAETPTVIDVLANDFDPEGGALTLLSANAVAGFAEVLQDDRLLYTPPPDFTGSDTVIYVTVDNLGAEAEGILAITVPGPMLSVTPNADGTLTIEAASGEVTLTVSAPPEFSGTYVTDTALLAGGPVNLAVPAILGEPGAEAELVASAGLWIHEGEVTGESWSWQRNGSPVIGATLPVYPISSIDAGTTLVAVQTLMTAAGSRSASSAPVAVPANFSPDADTLLIAWYDASDAATIVENGGTVNSWVNKIGTGSLSPSGGPTTGGRSIGGLDVIDFAGTARMTGALTLPASGDVALHAVIAIDTVTNAFSAPLSMRATRDFQLDANDGSEFTGRLNVSEIGDTFVLQGGPYAGALVLSIVFDRTGEGASRVFVNGILAGSGAYTTSLDTAQTLGIMTNRSQNALFDGAVGEVIVTGSISNAAEYSAYLAEKWGIV